MAYFKVFLQHSLAKLVERKGKISGKIVGFQAEIRTHDMQECYPFNRDARYTLSRKNNELRLSYEL